MTKLGSRFPLVGSYLFTPVLSSERCLIGVQRTIQQRFKPAWMANRAFLRLSIDVAHARPMDSPLQYGHRSPDSIEDTVMHSRSFTNYHVHYLHSLSRLFSLGAAWPSSTCFESVWFQNRVYASSWTISFVLLRTHTLRTLPLAIGHRSRNVQATRTRTFVSTDYPWWTIGLVLAALYL